MLDAKTATVLTALTVQGAPDVTGCAINATGRAVTQNRLTKAVNCGYLFHRPVVRYLMIVTLCDTTLSPRGRRGQEGMTIT